MPRISGLYNYIQQNAKDWIELDKAMLYKVPVIGVHPFIGFIPYITDQYFPHLRVDAEYQNPRSMVKGHWHLSYCHGTEYFSFNRRIYELHYHFTPRGQLSHVMAKEFSLSDPHNKSELRLSHEQICILECRGSANFSVIIAQLLQEKNQANVKLQQKIASELQNLQLMAEKQNPEVIQQQIILLLGLIQQKDKLEDRKNVSQHDPLINLLQSHAASVKQSASKKNPAANIDDKPDTTEATTLTSVVALETAVTVNRAKAKTSRFDTELQLARQQLQALATLSAQKKYQQYLDAKMVLLGTLLTLSIEFENRDKKTIDKLWADYNKQPKELDLLAEVIRAGDIGVLKEFYPYAKPLVTPDYYVDLIIDWVKLSYKPDSEAAIAKFKNAFDNLMIECETFRNTIFLLKNLFIQYDDNRALTLLGMAYNHKNIDIFKALLSYGIDAEEAWALIDQQLVSGLETMIFIRLDNCGEFLRAAQAFGFKLQNRYKTLQLESRPAGWHPIKRAQENLMYDTLEPQADDGHYLVKRLLRLYLPELLECKQQLDIVIADCDEIGLLYTLAGISFSARSFSLLCEITNSAGIKVIQEFSRFQQQVQSLNTPRNNFTSLLLFCPHENVEYFANKILAKLASKVQTAEQRSNLLQRMQQVSASLKAETNNLILYINHLAMALLICDSATELNAQQLTQCFNCFYQAGEYLMQVQNEADRKNRGPKGKTFILRAGMMFCAVITAFGANSSLQDPQQTLVKCLRSLQKVINELSTRKHDVQHYKNVLNELMPLFIVHGLCSGNECSWSMTTDNDSSFVQILSSKGYKPR